MFYKAFVLAASAALFVGGAQAQDNNFWKQVGNWEISIDPTIGNGCYAVVSWTGGTVLRIGLNPQRDNFYVLIGNDKWTALVPEQEYDIRIQFDRRPVWEVSARGFQFNPGETVYLHAQSTKDDFISEFMRANLLKLSYGGQEVESLKLNGSSRAFKEVLACQKAVEARGPAPVTDDPFASSKPPVGQGKKSAGPSN